MLRSRKPRSSRRAARRAILLPVMISQADPAADKSSAVAARSRKPRGIDRVGGAGTADGQARIGADARNDLFVVRWEFGCVRDRHRQRGRSPSSHGRKPAKSWTKEGVGQTRLPIVLWRHFKRRPLLATFGRSHLMVSGDAADLTSMRISRFFWWTKRRAAPASPACNPACPSSRTIPLGRKADRHDVRQVICNAVVFQSNCLEGY